MQLHLYPAGARALLLNRYRRLPAAKRKQPETIVILLLGFAYLLSGEENAGCQFSQDNLTVWEAQRHLIMRHASLPGKSLLHYKEPLGKQLLLGRSSPGCAGGGTSKIHYLLIQHRTKEMKVGSSSRLTLLPAEFTVVFGQGVVFCQALKKNSVLFHKATKFI